MYNAKTMRGELKANITSLLSNMILYANKGGVTEVFISGEPLLKNIDQSIIDVLTDSGYLVNTKYYEGLLQSIRIEW